MGTRETSALEGWQGKDKGMWGMLGVKATFESEGVSGAQHTFLWGLQEDARDSGHVLWHLGQ